MRAINFYLIKIKDDNDTVLQRRYKSLTYNLPDTMKLDKGVFPQIGEVISIPKGNPLNINEGDKVLCSHRINETKINKSTYYSDPFISPIFGVVNEDMSFSMKNNYVMVERILEEKSSETGIILTAVDKESLKEYTVTHTQDGSQLEKGMKIRCQDFKPYSFTMGDKTYFMLNEKTTVMAVIERGKYQPINEWVMIKPTSLETTETVNGIIRPKSLKNTFPSGLIHRLPHIQIPQEATGLMNPFEVGMEVAFIPKMDRFVEEDDEEFTFVRVDLRDKYDEIRFITAY